jgi:hypothetical protein
MSKIFTSEFRLDVPLKQIFEVECRYDKEWKTNFLTLYCTEINPKIPTEITSELLLCLNTKKDAKDVIKVLKKAMKKMR